MQPKGLLLTLKGKSLKGKNRVKENGSEWVVMQPSNEGQLVLIAPMTDSGPNMDRMRWVNKGNDPDFDITGWC